MCCAVACLIVDFSSTEACTQNYVDQKGLAAKRLAGVSPEVNRKKKLQAGNKAFMIR